MGPGGEAQPVTLGDLQHAPYEPTVSCPALAERPLDVAAALGIG
ncbi:hypothetical protein [Streptomyces misionensis]